MAEVYTSAPAAAARSCGRVRKKPAMAEVYTSAPAAAARSCGKVRKKQALAEVYTSAPPATARSCQQPPWACGGDGLSLEHPPWAQTLVRRLIDENILQRTVQERAKLRLQVWSDCGGIGSEFFAARVLRDVLLKELGLEMEWKLYCHCDTDARARKFVRLNHNASHTSDNMLHRDFALGTFWCDSCGQSHLLPQQGIDLYVAGYPCNPWSRRGIRTDFAHPDIQPFLIGIKTVNFLKPAMWLYETTEGVDDHRAGSTHSALDQVLSYIKDTINPPYLSCVVKTFDPTWVGYPTKRPRVFILNWRADLGTADQLSSPLKLLLREPLRVEHNYLTLLSLTRSVDWSRVGQHPTQDELGRLDDGCTCSMVPFVACLRHPCNCNRCGSSAGCVWRQSARTFLAEKFPNYVQEDTRKLTYIQVMELNGLPTPKSARIRNLLNLCAALPRAQPLNDTLLLADLSQSIKMVPLAWDGTMPTLATNSTPFCFQLGRFLTTHEKAFLMGFASDKMNFTGCSEAWFCARLGLSIHTASLGAILLALLTKPMSAYSL